MRESSQEIQKYDALSSDQVKICVRMGPVIRIHTQSVICIRIQIQKAIKYVFELGQEAVC